MEVLREPPNASSFVPLLEHQSTTPASFYSGPPVLHYYSDRSKVIILEREVGNAPAFAALLQNADAVTSGSTNGEAQANGDPEGAEKQKVLEDVDIWVTSDKLFLYSSAAAAGIAIPYPSISLHAIQTLPTPSPENPGQGVYMQLVSFNDESSSEDAEQDSFSVTLIPTASAPPAPPSGGPDAEIEAEGKPEQTPVQALFNSLSDCANLHPDPVIEGEEEESGSRLIRSGLAIPGDDSGGLPPPMPGSGGWITAENLHKFIDEDGNWIEGDNEDRSGDQADRPLGPGAGTVRSRDGEGDGGENGTDEAKWQRTS